MNERRRTLLFSGKFVNYPTENGVWIETIEHKYCLPDDWDSANTANSIAVVTDAHKFKINLHDIVLTSMDMNPYVDWDTYLSGTTNSGITASTVAQTDYSGAVNTQLIVTECHPNGECASAECYRYTFPDGVTKGYLPALGELYLAYQNKTAIDAALVTCDGVALEDSYYWSSTLYGKLDFYSRCWILSWSDGYVYPDYLGNYYDVRPFALLEDSN